MHLVSFQSTDQEVNQFNTKRGKVKQSLLFGFFINNVKSFLRLLKRLVKGKTHIEKKIRYSVSQHAPFVMVRGSYHCMCPEHRRDQEKSLCWKFFLTRVVPNSQLSHLCFFIYVQLVFCSVNLPACRGHCSADIQRENKKTTNRWHGD